MSSPFFRIRLQKRTISVVLIAVALTAGVMVILLREQLSRQSDIGSAHFVGKLAPDFTLSMLDGAEVNLAQFRGQPDQGLAVADAAVAAAAWLSRSRAIAVASW